MDFPLNEIFANPQKLIESGQHIIIPNLPETNPGVIKDRIISDLLPSINTQIDGMVANLYTQIMQSQPGGGKGLSHWLWRAGDRMKAAGDRMRGQSARQPEVGTKYQSPRWWQAIKNKLGLEHAGIAVYKDTYKAYLQLEQDLENNNIGMALTKFAINLKKLFRNNLETAISVSINSFQPKVEKAKAKAKEKAKEKEEKFSTSEKDVYNSLVNKLKWTPADAESAIITAKEAGAEGDAILTYILKNKKPPRPLINFPKPEPKLEPKLEPKPEPKLEPKIELKFKKKSSELKKKRPKIKIKLKSKPENQAIKKSSKKTTPPPPPPIDIDFNDDEDNLDVGL